MRVAIVQMNSTDDLPANMAAAERFVDEAAALDVEFIALPENFAYLRREGLRFPCAQGLDGEIVGAVRAWARRHRVRILGGSFPELVPGEERVHNTSVLVGPDGEVEAIYRKLHLFDVDCGPDVRFQESATTKPGAEPALAKSALGTLGMSICYDLRFPELYRHYRNLGASILTIPSAFTLTTGKDHWHPLLRARAIETQCWVLAPAQWGPTAPAQAR